MNNTLQTIFFFIAIISLFVILLLAKRQDIILMRYEQKETYKGFVKDVLWSVITSGGIFNPTVLLPWFDFSDKDDFEKKHLIAKNWILLFFLLVICGMFAVAYVTSH